MDHALEWKYDAMYDSWILEPSHVSRTQKTFKSPTQNHRHSSAETYCSPSPLRDIYSSGSPPRSFSQKPSTPSPRCLTDVARHDKGRSSKSWKRYWTCFKPPTDHPPHHHYAIRPSPKKEKQKMMEPSNALAKTRSTSLQAQFHASTTNNNNNNNSYYTSMNAEERDENLKAVVRYCKGTSTK